MDPRHPELALPRVEELIAQYKRIQSDFAATDSLHKLSSLEREGGLVIQELCLVAPRLHEALIKVSRTRRSEITRGVANPTPSEQYVAPNQAEVYIAEPKPRKKRITKKKKVEE